MNEMLFPDWMLPRDIIRCIFFMIRPDAEANAEVDRSLPTWRSQFELGGRTTARHRRHVSLLGVVRTRRPADDLIDTLCRRMTCFSAPPVEIRFDKIGKFGSDSIALFGSQEDPFAREIRQTLADVLQLHLSEQAKRFTPHMTVLHDDVPRREHPIDPIRWMARELVLIESLQGAGRHRECGRWDLQDGGRSLGEGFRSNKSQLYS